MDGLKVGNEALKKANEMFSIEEIEQIMDDTAEAIEKQKQIDDLLSGQLTQEDEDDVLKELDDLVAADENISELPEVPSTGMILCSVSQRGVFRPQEGALKILEGVFGLFS